MPQGLQAAHPQDEEFILTSEAGGVGYMVNHSDATDEVLRDAMKNREAVDKLFGNAESIGHIDLREGPNDEFLKHPELLPKAQRDRIAKANREWEKIVHERAARDDVATNAPNE